MDHELSESQQLLRQTAADLFARDYPLDRMRDIHRSEPRFAPELWRAMCELEWGAAPFDESIAGFEGSLLDAAVIIEQLGRAAAVTPYVHSVIASGLALAPTDPALARSIALGDALVIPALQPPTARPALSATANGNAIQLSGTIQAVPWLPLATHLLVDAAGSWALVDLAAGGTSFDRHATSTDEPLAAVTFDGATGKRVEVAAPTGDPLLLGATGQALALAGMSSRALDLAVDYARERIQFGRPIGAFQAIQHKCADMYIACQATTQLAYKAAWSHGGAPVDFGRAARYGKAMAGETAAFVTRQAIQVHGGVGFIDDQQVQLFYLGAVSAASSYGTTQQHREALAVDFLDRVVS